MIERSTVEHALARSSLAWRLAHELAKRVPVNHAIWRASEAAVLAQLPMQHPILDIGCGDGLFASLLFDAPVDVGIDLSISRLTKAEESGAYREVRVADAADLPFEDGAFATVFSNCVLEHIPAVDAVCQEASRVLRADGLFVFTVPTQNFGEFLFFPTVFRALGMGGLADIYIRALNGVFAHHHTEGIERWSKRLRQAGLEVEAHWPIMPRPLQAFWDIIMPFSALQLVLRWLMPGWQYPLQRLLLDLWREPLEELMKPTGRPGANMVIVARKPRPVKAARRPRRR